jgi:hypothetical protein
MARLKVFATPIGFHDAYVAAPSRKAALAAWGADADLFARGVASVVTDPELTKEPLASPGRVVRRSRGSADEQLAALDTNPSPTTARSKARSRPAHRQAIEAPAPTSRPKAARRPSRTVLDTAEAKLAAAEARHDREDNAIADRIAALQHERSALRARQSKERARLEERRDTARARYQAAIERWAAD